MNEINKKKLGNIGEDISFNYLEKLNYKVLKRNFRCRQGEIDIIAKEGEEYVFVEVKTRSQFCFGRPREAVNQVKQKHMYKAARYYLYKNGLEGVFLRFDVIEIYILEKRCYVNHLKNVDMRH